MNNLTLQQTIKSVLDGINTQLPKGVIAAVMWVNHAPHLRYSVRFMHDGVRHNLGTFITPEGAIEAMINMKNKKMFTISKAEADARFAAVVELSNEAAMGTLATVQHTAISGIVGDKSHTELAKQEQHSMMTAAFNSLPPTKFDSGRDFEFYWDEKDKIYIITPKMVKKFYDSMNSGRSSKSSGESDDGNDGDKSAEGEQDSSHEIEYGTGEQQSNQCDLPNQLGEDDNDDKFKNVEW